MKKQTKKMNKMSSLSTISPAVTSSPTTSNEAMTTVTNENNNINNNNLDDNDVLIDPYPVINLMTTKNNYNNDDDDDNDSDVDEDDNDDDRCTVISVPVGNAISTSCNLKQRPQSNTITMKTFVTNSHDHHYQINCDRENRINNIDGDNSNHYQNSNDDDDDADRTLKSQPKIPDINDRFYHHHPHYNNRSKNKKNIKQLFNMNIGNNNSIYNMNMNNADNDVDLFNKSMYMNNDLEEKMTTFILNGSDSQSQKLTENVDTVNENAAINDRNVIKNDNPLDSIISSSLSSIMSTSSSSSKQQQNSSDPNASNIQTNELDPIMKAAASESSTQQSTISSRLMPFNEQTSSSSSVVTNSITITPQISSSSSIENNDKSTNMNMNHSFGEPFAILSQKENSCHFIERRISLAKQAKVGRSIGKTLASLNNAVFDCKVLSRNHAVLWYQDGKFYLKDTCSSNGTFVNGQRLSATNERSSPQVIYSGDCIQFGVEVTEKKNVHSCVIATIRLFHPDGTEALKDQNDRMLNDSCFVDYEQQFLLNYPNSSIQIPPSQLIDLVCQIHQSKRKQALLEQQLESTKQIMKEALDSAKNGWRSLVEEDRFLSRIQTLQAQLEVCLIAKNQDSPQSAIIEALKQNNLKLIADKEKFEQESKNSLKKALESKISIETNLQSVQSKLFNKTDECRLLKESLESNIKELKCLATNCDKLKKEKDDLLIKLKNFEENGSNVNNDNNIKSRETSSLFSAQPDSIQKISQSTNTIQVEMLDQNCQTSSCYSKELKTSFEDRQTQTDQSALSSSDNELQQKLYEQAKCLIGNMNEKIEKLTESMVKQLTIIMTLIDKQIESVEDIRIHKVQSNNDEIVKKFKDNIQKFNDINDKNRSLIHLISDHLIKTNDIDHDRLLACDIDYLKEKLNNSDVKAPIITDEKSIQVNHERKRQNESKMTQTNVNTNYNDNEKQSSLMIDLLKQLRINENDCDDYSNDVENIQRIIKENFDKIFERNEQLTSINECLSIEINKLKDKHDWLSIQNQVSFSIAVLPLFIIFICFIIILYQPLSFIMATFGY